MLAKIKERKNPNVDCFVRKGTQHSSRDRDTYNLGHTTDHRRKSRALLSSKFSRSSPVGSREMNFRPLASFLHRSLEQVSVYDWSVTRSLAYVLVMPPSL